MSDILLDKVTDNSDHNFCLVPVTLKSVVMTIVLVQTVWNFMKSFIPM